MHGLELNLESNLRRSITSGFERQTQNEAAPIPVRVPFTLKMNIKLKHTDDRCSKFKPFCPSMGTNPGIQP